MLLPNSNILYVQKVLNVAKIIGIPAVSFSDSVIKGMTDDTSIFILQKDNLPKFNNLSIGIDNISVLLNRLDLVVNQPNFSVDATVIETSDFKFVKTVELRTNSTKIGFTCSSPKAIKGPVIINDVLETEITLTPETVDVIRRGVKAMDGKFVTLMNNEKETFVEVSDINNDIFKYTFPSQLINVDPTNTSFAFRYAADLFLSTTKNSSNSLLKVGKRGILNTEIDQINVYMLPKV